METLTITTHDVPKPEWYALYTLPKAEKRVYEKISKLEIEAFLPLHKVVRQWSDRKKKMLVPLFPNYVFVKTTPNRQCDLYKIKEFFRFVTCDKRPVIIPEKTINNVRRILDGDVQIDDNYAHYKVGQKVEVVEGNLKGLQGLLVNIKGKNRLVICVEALQSMVSIEINGSYVKPHPI